MATRGGAAGDRRGGRGEVLGRRRRAARRARRPAPARRHRRRPRLPAAPLLPLGQGARAHPRRRHPAAPEAGWHPRRGAGLSGPDQVAVRRDGLRVNALDWGGDGTPLLLLHPNGLGAGFFEPLALAVRDEFRPVAVDLRGHGGTDAPATRAGFGFGEMAADVLAVLDHLGIDETVAVGESLGGGVSVLVDGQRPGVIRRLLLCEPVAFSPDGRTLRHRAPATAMAATTCRRSPGSVARCGPTATPCTSRTGVARRSTSSRPTHSPPTFGGGSSTDPSGRSSWRARSRSRPRSSRCRASPSARPRPGPVS